MKKIKIDNKNLQRKIRRDEAVEFSKETNLKTIVFKNKKKYIRKKKHRE
jgi:hypothetical protein